MSSHSDTDEESLNIEKEKIKIKEEWKKIKQEWKKIEEEKRKLEDLRRKLEIDYEDKKKQSKQEPKKKRPSSDKKVRKKSIALEPKFDKKDKKSKRSSGKKSKKKNNNNDDDDDDVFDKNDVKIERVFSSPEFITVPNDIPVKDLSKRSLTEIPDYILSNESLTTLYLKYNDLESIDKIESFPKLKILDLSFNKIKVFPENLQILTSLEELRISDNFISKIPSNHLVSLNNLTILTLNGNHFDEFPKSLCSLSNIKILDLSYNSIPSIPKQIADMSSLVNLNVKYNKISRLTRAIGKLNELKVLNLQNNEIHSIPSSYFELSNLEELYVSHNKIESLNPEIKSSGSLSSLKVFDISFNLINLLDFNIEEETDYCLFPSIDKFICDRNHLNDIPDIFYYQFFNINELILKDNNIKNISENISYLVNLKCLDLSLNELESVPEEIFQLTSLKTLNLFGNNISSLPLFTSSLNQLEYLNVGYNKLTEIKIEKLEKLEELILCGNPIESLQDDFFSMIPNLFILYASNMKLKQIPDNIGELIDLDTIDFSFNQLSSLPSSFSKLTNLRSISFSQNKLVNTDKRESYEKDEESDDDEYDDDNVTEWDCNQYWLEFIQLQFIDFSDNQLNYIPRGLEPFIGTNCVVIFNNNPLKESVDVFDHNLDTKSNPRFQVGISEMVGRRSNMEDSLCIRASFSDNASLFALFDGHAGSEAAIWASENLPDFIKGKLPFDDPKKCFDDIFFVMNEELKTYLSYGNSSTRYCGTTAVIALFIYNRLIVANVGDSRAVLNTGKRLTVDHKPRTEIERILSHKGGYVDGEDGGRINGTIAVSRSIGDFFMHPWVSYEPHVISIDLTDDEKYLILACDGIWDEISDEKAIEIIDPLMKEGEIDLAAIKLRDTAYSLGSDDNISVVIVKFGNI